MSNVLAVLGIVCILTAVTLLASWQWALLVVGLVLIAAAWAAWTHETAQAKKAAG